MTMKRVWICFIALLLVVSLTACGQSAPAADPKPVDLAELWSKMEPSFPAMMTIDSEMRFNFLGIRDEDCVQCITLLSDDGLKADELWLLEASGDEAMDRLMKLAQQRPEAKAQETESYAPDQYEIVKQAKLLTSGHYLALIVTPEAEKAAGLFKEALG